MRRLARLYPGDRPLLAMALAVLGVGWAMALAWAPPDRFQGDVQRLMYVHVPAAWVALSLFGVAFAAAVRVLWRRTVSADHLLHGAVEVGVVFLALALALGALWGRSVWGVWWAWDPRLTTSAVLLAVFAGLLALRRAIDDPARRANVSAAVTVVAFGLVPVVHWSVVWWRSLHQGPSVLRPEGPAIGGSMLATLLVNALGASMLAGWLVMRRMRLSRLQERRDNRLLRERLATRAPDHIVEPREVLRG
jgi:heme exporter protein C